MTIICHLRARVFGSCSCRVCRFIATVDAILEDQELQDKAATIRHVIGIYR